MIFNIYQVSFPKTHLFLLLFCVCLTMLVYGIPNTMLTGNFHSALWWTNYVTSRLVTWLNGVSRLIFLFLNFHLSVLLNIETDRLNVA